MTLFEYLATGLTSAKAKLHTVLAIVTPLIIASTLLLVAQPGSLAR